MLPPPPPPPPLNLLDFKLIAIKRYGPTPKFLLGSWSSFLGSTILRVPPFFSMTFPSAFSIRLDGQNLERRLDVDVRGDSRGFDQAAWAEALQLRDEVLCRVPVVRCSVLCRFVFCLEARALVRHRSYGRRVTERGLEAAGWGGGVRETISRARRAPAVRSRLSARHAVDVRLLSEGRSFFAPRLQA